MLRICLLGFMLSIQNVISKNDEFVCPKDGRWPSPADCEKYFTCNTGISVEGWCGGGMTYDPDHQRCDLSKNIECTNGERPNWTPPENWGQSEGITNYVLKTTTESLDDDFNFEKKTKTSKRRKITTTQPRTIATRGTRHRVTLPVTQLVENTQCTFQGNMPDPENCQNYYTCREDVIARVHCPDRQLFDEDNRICADYRKVFCETRPVNERDIDPCIGQPNGWYADLDSQCRFYYSCTDQRKSKMGECTSGTKWNSQKLRCDDARNIPIPCGLRSNHGMSLSSHFIFIMILISFLLTFQSIV